MVRKGFFIGKRILPAFPRYARLASYEQAAEKDSYAFVDRPELCPRVRSTVSLQLAYGVWLIAYGSSVPNYAISYQPYAQCTHLASEISLTSL
jgi:hypothetical protein